MALWQNISTLYYRNCRAELRVHGSSPTHPGRRGMAFTVVASHQLTFVSQVQSYVDNWACKRCAQSSVANRIAASAELVFTISFTLELMLNVVAHGLIVHRSLPLSDCSDDNHSHLVAPRIPLR
eukprot:1921373-Pyramimonas_sp.AAC.1